MSHLVRSVTTSRRGGGNGGGAASAARTRAASAAATGIMAPPVRRVSRQPPFRGSIRPDRPSRPPQAEPARQPPEGHLGLGVLDLAGLAGADGGLDLAPAQEGPLLQRRPVAVLGGLEVVRALRSEEHTSE